MTPPLEQYILLPVIVAALTSLVIESPVGTMMREVIAGAPTKAQWAKYRAALTATGSDDLPPPAPIHPWLNEKMQCPPCCSFWVAVACVFAVTLPNLSLSLLCVSWLGARLLLSGVRWLEYVGPDE